MLYRNLSLTAAQYITANLTMGILHTHHHQFSCLATHKPQRQSWLTVLHLNRERVVFASANSTSFSVKKRGKTGSKAVQRCIAVSSAWFERVMRARCSRQCRQCRNRLLSCLSPLACALGIWAFASRPDRTRRSSSWRGSSFAVRSASLRRVRPCSRSRRCNCWNSYAS